MNAVGLVHAVTASLVPLAAVAVMVKPARRRGSVLTGLLALVALGTGLARQLAWEFERRRAVWLHSRIVGMVLERKAHFGVAALAFAVCLGVLALVPDVPSRVRRVVALYTVAFGTIALGIALYVRVAVPP